MRLLIQLLILSMNKRLKLLGLKIIDTFENFQFFIFHLIDCETLSGFKSLKN
jgi:hypothetical protein